MPDTVVEVFAETVFARKRGGRCFGLLKINFKSSSFVKLATCREHVGHKFFAAFSAASDFAIVHEGSDEWRWS